MGIQKYFTEVVREGRRVRWPTREQLLPALATVLIITVFAALFLMLEDWASGVLLQQLKQAFQSIKG